ncbi:hypothetical protein Pan44_25840 [Caulifigura coniformis]|uniref:Uncharacterized protein n=1 Tax=Caulifigura coniformis TaxID=2527983 RepID=A0A517SEK1_9PLAN|nr:hypothetical protein Pan44_25840 [Caulifigura coniformis]
MNVSTTRLPFMASRGVEVERRANQIQDPFPDNDAGPSMGFRPLEFEEQRSEIQRARDRSYAGFLRGRYTSQVPPGQSAPVFANAVPEPR